MGLLPRARLFVATVAEADGRAAPQRVAEAVEWLSENGAGLIAIPLGDSKDDDVLSIALTRGHEQGVLFFAASGNMHPHPVMFPARHSAVLAIGASDASGRLRPECCRIPSLDQVAPGTEIPALVRNEQIEARSGSSVACVVATALAALMKNPVLGRGAPQKGAAYHAVNF